MQDATQDGCPAAHQAHLQPLHIAIAHMADRFQRRQGLACAELVNVGCVLSRVFQLVERMLAAGSGRDRTNQNVRVRDILGNQVGNPVGQLLVVLAKGLDGFVNEHEILRAGLLLLLVLR